MGWLSNRLPTVCSLAQPTAATKIAPSPVSVSRCKRNSGAGDSYTTAPGEPGSGAVYAGSNPAAGGLALASLLASPRDGADRLPGEVISKVARFNQGPHPLGRGGEAWRILHDLGAPPRSPTATAWRPRRARRQAGRGTNRPAGLTGPQAADGICGDLGRPGAPKSGSSLW